MNLRPTALHSWQKLADHWAEIKSVHMRDMFQEDKQRFEHYSVKSEGLLFDYSKNRITEKTMNLFEELMEESGLREGIHRMFSGDRINATENRSVLHTALRNFSDKEVYADGEPIMELVRKEREKMKDFSDRVISGKFRGFTGKKIERVVHIGIGGSDLGPRMVCEALSTYQVGPEVEFVSNVDGAHLSKVLKHCRAETTLFIVVSKTFTTQETLTNARSAREWLLNALGSEKAVRKHFVAVSANTEKVQEFGIDPENQFEIWDWVGGRFSLWSAVGLSIAIHIGYDNFENLLKGAETVDEEFREAPFRSNIPVIMGALGIWYNNFFNAQSYAVLPYSQYMHLFPAYLQQGDMESNGKSVDRNGEVISYETGPVLWGKAGTNGQHAFYQLIHQGTKLVPCDFIGVVHSAKDLGEHQDILFSNFLAQTEALMKGRTAAELTLAEEGNPFKIFDGNRPSNSIVIDRLSPTNLGKMMAIYEHKIFVQGHIWNVYSFDQWGVELGKTLAKSVLEEIRGGVPSLEHDSSTNSLLQHYLNTKKVN